MLVLALGAAVFVVGAGLLALFGEWEATVAFVCGAAAVNTIALFWLAWKG